MTGPTKRDLKRDLEEMGDTDDGPRTEFLAGAALWWGDEPAFTEYLSTRGFVVEREERTADNGHQDVLLHTTPDVKDVFLSVTWHWPGPTTPNDAVRIRWDEDALETAREAAEYPVEYEPAALPEEPVTVVEGDGWDAVAEADLVAERMVDRRSTAERKGLEVLGDAPPISDREEYDLVEIDAPPVEYSDR